MMRDGKTCTHAGRNDVVEGETECRRERSPLGEMSLSTGQDGVRSISVRPQVIAAKVERGRPQTQVGVWVVSTACGGASD